MLRQCFTLFQYVKRSQAMENHQSFSFGFKVLRLFSQNRGTYILNSFITTYSQVCVPVKILQSFFLFQDTRKRKGLKEGLPDLTQYLDKL